MGGDGAVGVTGTGAEPSTPPESRPDGAGVAVVAVSTDGGEDAVLGAVEGGEPTDITVAAETGWAVGPGSLVPTGVAGNDAADPVVPLARRPLPVLVRS
jgi:hypothetical protein